MFPSIHKHITVASLEGGSAQEVKLSLPGITYIRDNDSLAEAKIKPDSSGPPALTWDISLITDVCTLRKLIWKTGLQLEIRTPLETNARDKES